MDEYTGQLIGGPDDGNLITSTVSTIPVKSVTELRLDGDLPDKDTYVITLIGEYTWDMIEGCFIWKQLSFETAMKKIIPA